MALVLDELGATNGAIYHAAVAASMDGAAAEDGGAGRGGDGGAGRGGGSADRWLNVASLCMYFLIHVLSYVCTSLQMYFLMYNG